MEIKVETDPVGNVVRDEALAKFIEAMKAVWDENKEDVPFWKFWKRISLVPVVNFLLGCLDDLIVYFIQTQIPGEDKKASVLNSIGSIYDHIIVSALPIYLKPFGPVIRSVIINVILSSAIDWIVKKYTDGFWNPKPQEEVVAQWTQLHAQLFGVPEDHRPKV